MYLTIGKEINNWRQFKKNIKRLSTIQRPISYN
jgi:hypothetical protein